jgi:hypothetical protein
MPTQKTHSQPLPLERTRAANLRTGALLTAIAAVFFVGMIVSHYIGGLEAGLAVVGIAVVLYLVVAIVRSVGSKR